MTTFRLRATLGLLVFLAPCAGSLAAEETIVVTRGTAGLTPVLFNVANAGPKAMACTAGTAHWYSVDLGAAPAGGSVRTTLWASVASGEVFVLNDKQDRMPLINLWCGLAGRSWETRSIVPLERAAGTVPKDISLSCRDAGDTLVCR